jgi:hypothetical protein
MKGITAKQELGFVVAFAMDGAQAKSVAHNAEVLSGKNFARRNGEDREIQLWQ